MNQVGDVGSVLVSGTSKQPKLICCHHSVRTVKCDHCRPVPSQITLFYSLPIVIKLGIDVSDVVALASHPVNNRKYYMTSSFVYWLESVL